MERQGSGRTSKAEDILFGPATSLWAHFGGYITIIEAICLRYINITDTWGLVTGGLCFFPPRADYELLLRKNVTGLGLASE
jgi:hypothetical protein